jgi:enoyl-CoA hydratase
VVFKNLLTEEKNNFMTVTINRPEKLNSLNGEIITELSTVFHQIQDSKEMRAVIITGAGQKAFVAGADIKEIHDLDAKSGREFSKKGISIFRFIEKMNIPVIAAINGFALGGGCELAMSCHLRIASANAKFGQPEINLGVIPGYGGTQRLPRLIGKTNAVYYLLTGDMIDANKAYELGLINELVKPEQLMERAEEIATLLASKAPIATQNILQAVDEGINIQLDDALNIEATSFGKVCGTNDMKEGTLAFIEKRKPLFKGN